MIHDLELKKRDAEYEDEEEERPLYLASFLEKLVGNRARSDVIFIVGENKVEIPAHRLILAAHSKIFEAMLYAPKGEDGERRKIKLPLHIVIRDATPENFRTLLSSIYTDEAEIETANLGPLINLAHKYQIEKLQLACSDFMEKDITVDNACELFEMAPKLLGDDEFALPFIQENTEAVLLSESFLALSPHRLEYLLKDDSLCVEEISVFNALREWAKVQVKKKGDELKGSESEKLKEVLTPYVKFIRFPTMQTEELATHVASAQLIDEKILLQLYQYCSLTEDQKSTFDLPFPTNPRSGGKRLKFSSIMDTNGMIYFIGSSGGKSTYSNPAKNGQVLVKISSTGSGSPVDAIADRDASSAPVENNYGGSDRNPWISVQFTKYLLRPSEYVICQDQDHFLQNWRFEGREYGKTDWILIEEYKNDHTIATKNPHRAVFKVKASRFFHEVRIYVTGPSHKGSNNFDITQLEFYGFYREVK